MKKGLKYNIIIWQFRVLKSGSYGGTPKSGFAGKAKPFFRGS
jgi:hypothetical protein